MSRIKRWRMQIAAEKLGMQAGYWIEVSALPSKPMTPLEIIEQYENSSLMFWPNKITHKITP